MSAAPSNANEIDTQSSLEPWVMLPDACRLIGKHRQQVLALVVRGELVADTRGRYTWISRESIERYLAAHPQ